MEKSGRIDLPDLMVVLGLALLAGGLGAFDWRLALITLGVILLAFGLIAVLRR